jgi:FMN-dependent dehydrogenase
MPLVNVAEYELRARQAAEGSTLDYYDGGSNDELTLRENAAAFSRITLYPRVFRGVDRFSPFSPRGGEGNTVRTRTPQAGRCG